MYDLSIWLEDRTCALAEMGEALASTGVSIEVLYSNHDHQLILVVDDYEKGETVSENWTNGVYT